MVRAVVVVVVVVVLELLGRSVSCRLCLLFTARGGWCLSAA